MPNVFKEYAFSFLVELAMTTLDGVLDGFYLDGI